METTHDAQHWAHRCAHRRAAWRTSLADELLRYVLLCALLIFLVRPLGVIVALVWGFGIAQRVFRGEFEPRLHRHFVRSELRRKGQRGWRDAGPESRPGSSERLAHAESPEGLAHEMGDDPRARAPLDWARTALEELADHEHGALSGARPVRVCDVVEDVVEAFEARAEREGISFRVEVDADGEVEADARRLRAVLHDLVGESVRALQRTGARGPARVHIDLGENLAGSQVWVRIRDDRLGAAAGARGLYGSRPVPGMPGATLETQASPQSGVERILTLEKSPGRAPGNGRAAPAPR
jgi:hypothetical protein